jgi:hypothetical protein
MIWFDIEIMVVDECGFSSTLPQLQPPLPDNFFRLCTFDWALFFIQPNNGTCRAALNGDLSLVVFGIIDDG